MQTDNKQPFYIKINDKLYSSSAGGYAIVPKLQKGDYKFLVGFPKNEFAQQTINVSVDGDAGYMLKNFGDKGWGLYNIQTMSVNMAGEGATTASATTIKTKSDDFSNTLAGVVNTPSIKKEETVAPVVATPVIVPSVETKPVVVAKTASAIKEMSSTLDNSGRSIVYNDGADTIRIFIPYDKPVATLVTEPDPAVRKETKDPIKKDSKFLDIELDNPNTNVEAKTEATKPVTAVAETKTEEPVVKATEPKATEPIASKELKPLMINSDCKSIATDDDFLKIRKKMASEDTDDAMIAAAKKMFKLKCYSTDQIKNLSVLFLKDSGKYAFFDAAYPFINDTYNFGKLEAQLSDAYYITRFKAMIRN